MHTYNTLINTHKFLKGLLEKFIHTAANTLPPLLGVQVTMFPTPPAGNKGRCFVSTCAAPYNPPAHKSERKHPLSSHRLSTALPPSAANQAAHDRAAALTQAEVARRLQALTNQVVKSGFLICLLQKDLTHVTGRKGNITIFLAFGGGKIICVETGQR